jgi:hypothetical protein
MKLINLPQWFLEYEDSGEIFTKLSNNNIHLEDFFDKHTRLGARYYIIHTRGNITASYESHMPPVTSDMELIYCVLTDIYHPVKEGEIIC